MERALTDAERTEWVRARVAPGTPEARIVELRATLWDDEAIDMAVALGG